MIVKQKQILLLGGLRYLIPVIKAAHEQGLYVITCDYLPNNIAHKYADEYHNVSILDKEAVLNLAKELGIDGIMSFAVDPGVLTAAYVCEKLGLPGNPYNSVRILQNKDLFRNFLKENGFNTPKSQGYHSLKDALANITNFKLPIIVKPVDSAGSKGVTFVGKLEDLEKAIALAIDNSHTRHFIIEEYIEAERQPSDSDAFSIDGKLTFMSFSNQYFDNKASNPFTPSGFCWPSTMALNKQNELTSEIQRLLYLLNMRTSIYNIETRIGRDGKAYIMEVSPRGGGNRLSEMLYHVSGVDLIKNAVCAAVGEKKYDMRNYSHKGFWSEVILHADKAGLFKEVSIDEEFKKNIIELDLWVRPGDEIQAFNGANNTIGTMVVKFENEQQQITMMADINSWVKVITN